MSTFFRALVYADVSIESEPDLTLTVDEKFGESQNAEHALDVE